MKYLKYENISRVCLFNVSLARWNILKTMGLSCWNAVSNQMRAAMLARHCSDLEEGLTIEDVPPPKIAGEYEVVIDVAAAGYCRTDNHIIKGKSMPPGVSLPLILGHENTGYVERIGNSVTSIEVGDKVSCMTEVTCGVCRPCRLGEHDVYCENLDQLGVTMDGGFAEYLKTNERSIIQIGDVDPIEIAPMADAGTSAYRPAKKIASNIEPGGFVAIFGIGGLGHVGLQVIKKLASVSAICIDVKNEALELADKCGADYTLNPKNSDVPERIKDITNGRGVDQVLDFVGTKGTLNTGPDIMSAGGDFFVVGYEGDLIIDGRDLVVDEYSYHGSRSGSYSDHVELLNMVENGDVEFHVTTYPLDEISKVARKIENGDIVGRAVLV